MVTELEGGIASGLGTPVNPEPPLTANERYVLVLFRKTQYEFAFIEAVVGRTSAAVVLFVML